MFIFTKWDVRIFKMFVFFDFAVDNDNVGRVVLELYDEIVPKSVENFLALCTGEKGCGISGNPLHYKNSIVHKAIPEFMIQCGDITNFDGTGGESIYGLYFDDENFILSHDVPGIVGLANTGKKNTNNSQFYITTVPCPHLDGKNVAIGKVVKGLSIVKQISECATVNDKPLKKYEILNCGRLGENSSWDLCEKDGTSDMYPSWPDDWDKDPRDISLDRMKIYAENIKNSGNIFYSQQWYAKAERKYLKAMTYINWYINGVKHLNRCNENAFKNTLVACLLNLSAVKLQTESYRECIDFCLQVLRKDKDNIKAIFRIAQANIALNNHEIGLQYLNKAHRIMPRDKVIINEIRKVKKFMKDYLNVEKKTYAKMFKNL